MKQLLARLRGHKAVYKTIFEDTDGMGVGFFSKPSISDGIEYAPFASDLKKSDWLYVELDAEQVESMIDPYIQASMENDVITQPEYDLIDALFMVDGRQLIFSRITSSMKIGEQGKPYLQFGEEKAEIVRPSFAINFTGDVDAYYDGETKLYFKSLSKIKPLFKGIESFYQEASRDEKEQFLANDFFDVDDINPDFIGIREAHQIVAILDNSKIDLDDDATQQKVRDYANKYPSSGAKISDEGRVIIRDKKDLSATLKLLDQRFFTGELTGEKLIAKNASKMGN